MWPNLGHPLQLSYHMRTMLLVDIQEYWSTNKTNYIQFYFNTFTKDRFTQIFWMLHVKAFSIEDTNPITWLQLITDYLDYINSYFNELRKLKFHLTGTILTNRKELPNAIRKYKFLKKSMIAYRRNNNLILS